MPEPELDVWDVVSLALLLGLLVVVAGLLAWDLAH